MKTEFLIVKNNLIAETTWGRKRVINLTNGEAIWINDTTTSTHIKPGEQIEVIRDSKNKLSIIDRGEDKPNIPKSNGYVNNGTTTTQQVASQAFTSPKEEASISDARGAVGELPNLSDIDKRKMMEYIRSQSKLLKFCYDTVCQDFPTLEEYDARGARSLAISLLISSNQARDRYLK